MRITNSKHIPWFIFVVVATLFACWLYVGNFHPDRLPAGMQLPPRFVQTPSDHRSIGGTPIGLAFGAISLAIFIFAALLSLRKKIPLWRIGTVQRWLRAHIWLTFLTIPLVILHSGFRFGGPMTMLLMALYAVVMISGIYGLVLQHLMPALMKERLPAETVFEQIPHIRAQLFAAAEKMRNSFKPAPLKQPDAGAPAASATKAVTAGSAVMASTKADISTPVARAKTAVGSAPIATPIAVPETISSVTPAPAVVAATLAAAAAAPKTETIGTPTARVQGDPPGLPVARADVPAGNEPAPEPPAVPAAPPVAPTSKPTPAPLAPMVAKPVATPPKVAPQADPVSEAALVEFIERQILPYLGARRGERFRMNNPRFSDDTFRFVKLRVSETYRSRVEEIQAWCDERRLLDLQTRLQHWLHGWLIVHVPFSFLLLMLTIWHAYVTLFYY
ncbi:MAG: hypothetical protein ABJB09_07960 [Verrucomicrobiota bacterium]